MALQYKILLVIGFLANQGWCGKTTHFMHWNASNPMFRIDNTEHVIDINVGNQPWEYDQANIICPIAKTNRDNDEQYIIYNVSKEEYDSCHITSPEPRIVAKCTDPRRVPYFTITFRSFSPTPGGLEFRPGQDYYFITTSKPGDLHRKMGGRCKTHNMKVIFKVANNSQVNPGSVSKPSVNMPRVTTPQPTLFWHEKNKYYPEEPLDPALDQSGSSYVSKEKVLESARKVVRDYQKHRSQENEVIKQEASRMASDASIVLSSSLVSLLVLFISRLL